MEPHLPTLYDCFMRSNCLRNPNDPIAMRQRDFVEMILKDVKLQSPPLRAELEIMHRSESASHPSQKFLFSCFVKCVIKIATRKKSKNYTDVQLVALTVKKYFVPLAEKRKSRPIESELSAAASMKEKFFPCIRDCFQFFAKMPTQYEQEELKRHGLRKDMNQMTQSLPYHDYQNICACFNLSASVGTALTALNASELAFAFFDSINVRDKDVVGGLTVDEFWEVLVRCCVMYKEKSELGKKLGGSRGIGKAKGENEDSDSGDVPFPKILVEFFSHISNNFEDSVGRLLDIGNSTEKSGGMKGLTAGHRDAASGGALLQKGTHEFSRLVWEILRLDEKEEIDVVPSVEENTDERLWKVFLHCNTQNNARDWMNMKKRELVMLIRNTGLPIMEADVNVIHQHEQGRHPHKRFEFDDFKTALNIISGKVYQTKSYMHLNLSKSESFKKLLTEHLFTDESLMHYKTNVTDEMADCAEFLKLFDSGLKKIFMFFAGNPSDYELDTLGRHALRADINQTCSSLPWGKYLDFAAAANLSSGTGAAMTALSLQQISAAFADSIEVWGVNDVGGLNYEEFLESLVRCSVAFQFPNSTSGLTSLELMFYHMSHNFETSIAKIINSGSERTHHSSGPSAGARANSSNFGKLLQGIKEFNSCLFAHGSKNLSSDGPNESIFSFAGGESSRKDSGAGNKDSLLDFANDMQKGL